MVNVVVNDVVLVCGPHSVDVAKNAAKTASRLWASMLEDGGDDEDSKTKTKLEFPSAPLEVFVAVVNFVVEHHKSPFCLETCVRLPIATKNPHDVFLNPTWEKFYNNRFINVSYFTLIKVRKAAEFLQMDELQKLCGVVECVNFWVNKTASDLALEFCGTTDVLFVPNTTTTSQEGNNKEESEENVLFCDEL